MYNVIKRIFNFIIVSIVFVLEAYPSYKSGEIVISKIEQCIDENGKTQYRITYSDNSDDENLDAFIRQTISMTILND